MESSPKIMHRPYVSGPMSGIEFHNFPAFFEAADELREMGCIPQNPAATMGDKPGTWFATWREAYDHALENPQMWETYIHKDVQMLLYSDGLILLDGWEKSKGACLEVVIAVNCGYPIGFFRKTMYIEQAEREAIYATALQHLKTCMLAGVELTPEGFAAYA